MLKVWGRKTSINVQKVMWTIGELGLAHQRFDAGGQFGGLDTPEYARLNPNRLVPTIDDEGFILWESNAIVRHLAQKHGRGKLSPADEQTYALADSWMKKGQEKEAMACLEKVMKLCPNSKTADLAQVQLTRIQGRNPATPTGGTKKMP